MHRTLKKKNSIKRRWENEVPILKKRCLLSWIYICIEKKSESNPKKVQYILWKHSKHSVTNLAYHVQKIIYYKPKSVGTHIHKQIKVNRTQPRMCVSIYINLTAVYISKYIFVRKELFKARHTAQVVIQHKDFHISLLSTFNSI